MALTNVWCRDASGEWVRTTAEETDRQFQYTVSASSRMFRCYSCFQYVTFVKSGDYRSHFRHNSAEASKQCEDRSLIYGSGSYTSSTQADAPAPMKLTVDRKRINLEIGFLPVSTEELQRAVDADAVLSIHHQNSSERPYAYRVDYSRFAPHTMTWIHLPLSWATAFRVSIRPAGAYPAIWAMNRPGLSKSGELFNCDTGRRIPEKSDVMVGKPYYLLCGRGTYAPNCRAVQIQPIDTENEGWTLYRICANAYSDEASDFFFDRLHLRLTTAPADVEMLWPAAVEDEDMIDTNRSKLIFLVSGESDFETFPVYGHFVTKSQEIAEHERIVYLNNTGALQMVSASRYGQKLRCLYIRPFENMPEVVPPQLQVLDDDRNPVTEDTLFRIPKNKVLVFNSEVDASVDVEDESGILYRKHLPSGSENRITDLAIGMKLTVRQGLDPVRIITIERKSKDKPAQEQQIRWKGRQIPFPRRYAGILAHIDHSSELYARTLEALKTGLIPEDGLRSLKKMMEDNRRGR